jgi:colanic acid/amylovoran biosynthesis glycosyltransferase
MRLVMIVPRFPQLSETFIINKFVHLAELGWDVHIICQEIALGDWNNFPELAARPGLRRRVHRQWPHKPRWLALLFWLPALISTFLHAPRLTWNYWRRGWSLFGARTARNFYLDTSLIGLNPDILHFEFGALAVGQTYLKKLLECYLVVSFRGYDLNYSGLEDPDYYEPVWVTADAVHVLGRDLWRRALLRGCPPDKPHALIPPAIDPDYFRRAGPGSEVISINSERPLRILSVGRLEWKRGYEYALQAMKLLGGRQLPFEYRIIGAGSYLESLTFARHELGLEESVHFLGGQNHDSVLDALNWADVFVHPAVSEGFSNAVLEAQAMELPVICTDADGLPENVAHGQTGYVVPRRDPEALAEKLALLASDRELRRGLGQAGRARIENCFSLERQIAAFDRFYQDMVTSRAR